MSGEGKVLHPFVAPARWQVVAIYRIKPSRANVRAWVEYIKTWEIEELDELDELIELGPEWCALVDIRITLQRNSKPGFIIGSDLEGFGEDDEESADVRQEGAA